MLTQTMLTQTPLLRWASQQPVEHRELEEACDTSLGLSAPNTIKINKTTAKRNQFPSQGFSLCILLSKNGRSKSGMPGRNLHEFSRMCRRKLVLLRSEP